jgi:hypothetical protein
MDRIESLPFPHGIDSYCMGPLHVGSNPDDSNKNFYFICLKYEDI